MPAGYAEDPQRWRAGRGGEAAADSPSSGGRCDVPDPAHPPPSPPRQCCHQPVPAAGKRGAIRRGPQATPRSSRAARPHQSDPCLQARRGRWLLPHRAPELTEHAWQLAGKSSAHYYAPTSTTHILKELFSRGLTTALEIVKMVQPSLLRKIWKTLRGRLLELLPLVFLWT